MIPWLIYRSRKRPRPEAPVVTLPEFGFVSYTGLQLDPEHRDCVWLPASFMRALIADPTFNAIARLERDYVAEIAVDIELNGLQQPLIIVLDNESVCLRDGHHRVVAGVLDHYPVMLEYSERIRKHRVPMRNLVDVLCRNARGRQV